MRSRLIHFLIALVYFPSQDNFHVRFKTQKKKEYLVCVATLSRPMRFIAKTWPYLRRILFPTLFACSRSHQICYKSKGGQQEKVSVPLWDSKQSQPSIKAFIIEFCISTTLSPSFYIFLSNNWGVKRDERRIESNLKKTDFYRDLVFSNSLSFLSYFLVLSFIWSFMFLW